MKRLLYLLVSIFFALGAAAASNPDLELMRHRLYDINLEPDSPLDTAKISYLMRMQSPDGSWPYIDYDDTRFVAFQNDSHLQQLEAMARAYKLPGSPFRGSRKLRRQICAGVDFWLDHDYISENWWHNQIGTPMRMLRILYLLDKELGKRRIARMLPLINRANLDAPGARPGGDRLKIAGLYAQQQLWLRNEPELVKTIALIEREMRYYTPEEQAQMQREHPQYFKGGGGLQADLSFHHRHDRVNNTLTYGGGHASAFCEWAMSAYGTRYQFKDESVNLMVDYYLDGMCRQMPFALQSDPAVLNRELSRAYMGKQLPMSSILDALLLVSNYRRDELEAVRDLRAGVPGVVPASYAKMFFNTEYMSFQRPGFFTSVRMFSTRNMSMERPYNGEGLLNHYRGDGSNHLCVTGEEYVSIYPCFDFRRVPGATIMQLDGAGIGTPALEANGEPLHIRDDMPDEDKVQNKGVTEFVGGVDDGLYGAAAFDFFSPLDSVRAHKAWFFFDDAYVCLGAGISHEGPQAVSTAVNQCFLQGEVLSSASDAALARGTHSLGGVQWVWHDGVGYVFPQGADITVVNRAVEGAWSRINRQTSVSHAPVVHDMFCLSVEHGRNPQGASYEYVVLPGVARDAMAGRAAELDIIANTEALQAVFDPRCGVAYAAMYEAGTVRVGACELSCDAQAVVLMHMAEGKLSGLNVSDPSRRAETLHITVTEAGESRTLEVAMPTGALGGSSVRVF